ncbi:DUF3631 domain-containing protein [Saccharothrix saharensis]|uniref:DUF3631 domain-containing protein n=1 Tax=Saccharothrix saharensis TaxID=571190 RepID=UPI0036746DC8
MRLHRSQDPAQHRQRHPGRSLTAPTSARHRADARHHLTPVHGTGCGVNDTTNSAHVLDTVQAFLSRFNAYPDEHCAPMLALWCAHTWAAEHFYVTPRLVLSSAEPGSGKTRVLEVARHLVKSAEMTFSATSAALFRMVGAGPITILFDEVDAIFDTKGSGNEDLRALLNAGYKRSATVARCKGDANNMTIERFPVYAPAALAGIAGRMPATITTRAITVHMRRRRADEIVEAFRERRVEAESAPIRDALAAWIESVGEQVGAAVPEMPEGVTDRSAEIWEPLLAIAEAAGGDWPEKARAACLHFVTTANATPTSPGIRLLADLRTIFAERNVQRMSTVEILAVLHSMDEAPWGDLYGKPLTARQLASELGVYGVKVTPYKSNGKTFKGYVIDGETGLGDAWARYLPAEVSTASQEGL